MQTKREPSYTELRKNLAKALRNPKNDKRASLLLSSGNSEYYMQRAMELIAESRECAHEGGYHRIHDAILLLAAVEVIDGQTEEK